MHSIPTFFFSAFLLFFGSIVRPRIALAAEVFALRQQLGILQRTVKWPQLHRRDRFFLVALSQLWKDWRKALIILKPETVIKWHREGLRSLLALEVESTGRTTEH